MAAVWDQEAVVKELSPCTDITVGETLAWALGIINYFVSGIKNVSCVDNLPSFNSIRKGHSKNKVVNKILAFIFGLIAPEGFGVVWVPSQEQRADNPSRGIPLEPQQFQHPLWIREPEWG